MSNTAGAYRRNMGRRSANIERRHDLTSGEGRKKTGK
jgi:hypothetical protein